MNNGIDGIVFMELWAFFSVLLTAAVVLVVLYDRFAHYFHRRHNHRTYHSIRGRAGEPMHQ